MPGPDAIPDGPDADLLEQREVVDPDVGGTVDPGALTRDIEAPEADAFEQAQDVPLPPEEDID